MSRNETIDILLLLLQSTDWPSTIWIFCRQILLNKLNIMSEVARNNWKWLALFTGSNSLEYFKRAIHYYWMWQLVPGRNCTRKNHSRLCWILQEGTMKDEECMFRILSQDAYVLRSSFRYGFCIKLCLLRLYLQLFVGWIIPIKNTLFVFACL